MKKVTKRQKHIIDELQEAQHKEEKAYIIYEELKPLHDNGTISPSDYERLRKAIKQYNKWSQKARELEMTYNFMKSGGVTSLKKGY